MTESVKMCGDCYYPVPVDARVCPRCGAEFRLVEVKEEKVKWSWK